MKTSLQLRLVPVADSVQDVSKIRPFFSPDDAFQYYKKYIRPTMSFAQEHLHVILVNGRHKPIGWVLVTLGSVNATLAPPVNIFRPVITSGAAGFFLVHNHPSGESSPSLQDHNLTKKIKKGAELLQLEFIDHIIASDLREGDFHSYRTSGQL